MGISQQGTQCFCKEAPLAGGTDRSKLQDEDMFDPADVRIHSTPESHGSNVNPRPGDSREGASVQIGRSGSLMVLFPTPERAHQS